MQAEPIIALDVPGRDEALAAAARLPADTPFVKVGLELFCATGPAILGELGTQGRRIFLDLKLHDIPRTVARAVQSAGRHGVELLTLHACGGRAMLTEAAAAARDMGHNRPRLLAVTVLTSLNDADLKEIGVHRSAADQVLALAELAVSCGIDGLVCSPHEAAAIRRKLGPTPIIVTPGIRMPGGAVGDQKRVATPADAVKAGANYLVIGRPVLEAADPAAALRIIRENMKI